MSDLAIHKHTLNNILIRLERMQKLLEAEAKHHEAASAAANTKKVMDWKEHWRMRAGDKLSAAMLINKEINNIREILI